MNLVKRVGYAVLILLILLNVLGYYGVFMGLEYQHDRAMLKILDTGAYDDNDEITIKIPLSVPYLADADEFNRVDGRFEHAGELYRKVRQRYSRDTLHLVCVRDHAGTQIQHALKHYVKTFSDKPSDSRHTSKISLTLIKEYLTRAIHFECRASGWHYGLSAIPADVAYIPSFSVSINHPPE